MRITHRSALLAALLVVVALVPQLLAATGQPTTARGSRGMVVAAEPFAAEAGLEIIRRGGNAVDAAVAVGFALAVTHPIAGNIGGGGFMLIRLADGTAVMVDYREVAPAAATWDMYLDENQKLIPGSSTEGWKAAGVPGSVAGMALALEKYGTMKLREVMAPAIRLADKGFPVSERLARELQDHRAPLSHDEESRRLFLREHDYYQPGEIFRQKELARTLKKIADKGPKEFYQGSLARRLVQESKRGGGLFTREDLANYRPALREPLRAQIRGYEIYAAPPPSSGGVALIETLNILDHLLADGDSPEKPETLHLLAEALRRSFADRAQYLADPDFAPVPVAGLTDRSYAAAFAKGISRERCSISAELERPDPLAYEGAPAAISTGRASRESENTTHYSVIDAEGNIVSTTTTLNGNFGNKVTVAGLGFLLNNEMDDFTVEPGGANALFELVQSEANKVEPGKRPLSSMTPTIVVREGENILALGSPGGGRIISAVIQTVLFRLFFGDDLALAVARPRLHHQWVPDELRLEEGVFTESQINALKALGHAIKEIPASGIPSVGQINAAERDPESGELYGVADARRGGAARGY
jgi:gamma-glutamyltranspeptidase/glutathione hydrolase